MTAMTLTLQEERWCESQINDLNQMLLADHPRVILDWAEEIFAPCLRFYFRPKLHDFIILRLLESIGSGCDILVSESSFSHLPQNHPYASVLGSRVLVVQSPKEGLLDCEAWISGTPTDSLQPLSIDKENNSILRVNPLAHLSSNAVQHLADQLLTAEDQKAIRAMQNTQTANRLRNGVQLSSVKAKIQI